MDFVEDDAIIYEHNMHNIILISHKPIDRTPFTIHKTSCSDIWYPISLKKIGKNGKKNGKNLK